MRNQPKGRQKANNSNMSNNSRGLVHKSQPGAAYVDGPRPQPGKREQVQRVARVLEGNIAVARGENQMPVNSDGKIRGQSDIQRVKKKKTKSMMMGTNQGTLDSEEDLRADAAAQIAERNRLAKKYKQMRKTGEHGQTHTGQILRHSNLDGEGLVEMADGGNAFIEENAAEPGVMSTQNAAKRKPLAANHRRGKSGASEQLAGKNTVVQNAAGTSHQGKVVLFKNDRQTK